jgi:hypothetical protein
MQILRDEEDFACALDSWPDHDQDLVQLLQSRLAFYADHEEPLAGLFKLILVEPGDTLASLDSEFGGALLINHFSGRRYGDPGFKPAFEVLEESPGFYAMLFCEGDGGFGIEVIVPKSTDIDTRLLNLCAQFATLAPPLTP